MNKWRVETYDDPNNFYNNMKYEEDSLYVVATSAIAMHLKILKNFEMHKNHVWTYANFQKAINVEFSKPINQVKMKVEIRRILENNCDDKKIYKNLVNNIENILSDYKLYIQSGISKLEEYDDVSEEVKLVRKSFNIFCRSKLLNELYYKYNIYNLDRIIENLNEYYEKIFLKNINKTDGSVQRKINTIKKIYFYNLTYIDEERFYFFKKMCSLGIEVVFRIPCSGFSKPWEKTYSFISKDKWTRATDTSKNNNNGNKYTSYLNGEYIDDDINNKRVLIKEYIDPYEFKLRLQQYPIFQSNSHMEKWMKWTQTNYGDNTFKREVKGYGREREYLTFSKDSYNNIFNGTILNYKDKNSSFLYFNEGRFLNGLYNCRWDDDNEHINIDYKSYSECILSGWIEIKSKSNFISGKDASDLLIDLKTYMNGIQSIDDIINRLYRLTYLQEFSNSYDNLSKNKTQGDKVQEYLHNPLKVLSYVDNNRYKVTVKQLIELTKKLKKYIEQLIPKNNMIELEKHKEQLIEYWKNISYIFNMRQGYFRLKKECEKNQDPRLIKYIKQYRHYLKFEHNLRASDITSLCTIEEVKEYMKVILRFSVVDDDESEISHLNIIKIFEQIEGVMVNGTKEIYITDLSEKSIRRYAASKKNRIYYGDEQTLKRDISSLASIYNINEIDTIIKQHTISKSEILNFIKYYIGAVISFSSAKIIEFSWIREINENDQQSTIFKVLSMLYGGKTQKKMYFNNKEKLLSRYKEYKDSINAVENNLKSLYEINVLLNKDVNTGFHEDISPMAWIDLDFCPQKFFYSGILNFYPVYDSEFHQQIVFSIIGKLLKSQFEESKDVEKYFYYLFPQWNMTTKDNLIETAYKRDIRKEYKFKNIYFPYHAKDLQILRSKSIYTSARKAYSNMYINSERYMKEFIKNHVKYDTVDANKGYHCSMCSCNMLCNRGEFAIERSNY